MALSFIALVAIQVGLILLGRLFAPRAKRQKPGPIEPPTSSSGQPITKVYGIGVVEGNVGLVRDIKIDPETLDDGTEITRVYAKLQIGVCWGPVDVLYDIIADERSARLQEWNEQQGGVSTLFPAFPMYRANLAISPVVVDINLRQFFGGDLEQGGMQGEMRWWWGLQTQPIDSLVQYANGDLASSYPHLAHACFGTGTDGGSTGVGPVTEVVSEFIGQQSIYQSDYRNLIGVTVVINEGEIDEETAVINRDYQMEPLSGSFVFFIAGPSFPLSHISEGAVLTIHITSANTPTESSQEDQFYWAANSSSLRPLSFVVGCYPNALLGAGTGQIGLNANPIEMLYDQITNPIYGQSELASWINVAQWTEKAQQCVNESLGLSKTYKTPEEQASAVADILTHIRGEIVQNPTTGLLEIILARNDYDPTGLPVISHENATKPKHSRVTFGKTINHVHVRFQRFHGGLTGTLTEVVASPAVQFPSAGWPSFQEGPFRFESGGVNLTGVSAFAEGVELVERTESEPTGDYTVNRKTGLFIFYHTASINVGDELTVSFVSSTSFAGFVDDVAEEQNHAGQQILGRTQDEYYDYPLFTDMANAKLMAQVLLKTVSRQLDGWSWVQDRSGSQLKQGDVVRLHDPDGWGIENTIVRIVQVGIGTRESPGVSIRAIEDIYGEELDPLTPSVVGGGGGTGTVSTQAPAILISCGGGSFRVFLFPVNTTFRIQVQVSDVGTPADAVDITAPGGMVFDPDAAYIDYLDDGDPWPAETVKFFRARLLAKVGFTDGPWSSFISCEATGGDPTDPVCTLPTFTLTPVQGEFEGQLLFELTGDVQGRFRRAEFATQPAVGLPTDWAEGTSATVAVAPGGLISFIGARVRYTGCDGVEVIFEQVFQFTSAPTNPPNTGQPRQPHVELGFITAQKVFANVPAGETALGVNYYDWWDTGPFERAVITAVISATDMPVGSYIAFKQFQADNSEQFLDGVDGPKLPLDLASVTAAGGVLDGVPVTITSKRRGVIKAVFVNGDGSTGCTIERLALQFVSAGETVDDPDDPEDPPDETPQPGPDDPPAGSVLGWWEADTNYTNGSPDGIQWDDVRGIEKFISHIAGPVDDTGVEYLPNILNGHGVLQFKGTLVAAMPSEIFDGQIAAEAWMVAKFDGATRDLWLISDSAGSPSNWDATINEGFCSSIVQDLGAPVVDLTDWFIVRILSAPGRFEMTFIQPSEGSDIIQQAVYDGNTPSMPTVSPTFPYSTNLQIAELFFLGGINDDAALANFGSRLAKYFGGTGTPTVEGLIFVDDFEENA